MGISGIDELRALEQRLLAAPAEANASAARRIGEKLKADATSRRGIVPPGIEARPTRDGVEVIAPDWVGEKAEERGQPEEWARILAEEEAAALGRALK